MRALMVGERFAIFVFTAMVAATAGSQETAGIVVLEETRHRDTLVPDWVAEKSEVSVLEVESVTVEVALPSGKRYRGPLLLLREPSSGLFWWTLGNLVSVDARLAFYVSDTEILSVKKRCDRALSFQHSESVAASFDEAQGAALAVLADNTAVLEKRMFYRERRVWFTSALPWEFFSISGEASGYSFANVRTIARHSGGWGVALEGREGMQARVVLDDHFNVLSVGLTPQRGVERSRGFVDAVNTGDASVLAAYIREHYAPAAYARRLGWGERAAELVRDLGHLELIRIDVEGADEVDVFARREDDMMVRLAFTLAAGWDQQLAKLSIDVERDGLPEKGPDLPAPAIKPGMSEGEVVAALTTYFDRLGADGLFSGTALVARDGEIIFETAQGLANQHAGVPNHLGTRFNLGSLDKIFTGSAIGQLIDTGLLRTGDTITDHLPDYPNPDVAGLVAVGQLLDRRSGPGGIFNDSFFRSSRARKEEEQPDYFALVADKPLPASGSRTRYGDGGQQALAAILEAITGQSYEAYVEANIFAPAGMVGAGFWTPDDELEPDIATGYTRQDLDGFNPQRTLRDNTPHLPSKENPAGSVYATARDLFYFDCALRAGRLPIGIYGMFFLSGSHWTTRYMHGLAGGAPGVSAALESEWRMTLVVLSNYEEPSAERIARKLYWPLWNFMHRTR